MAALRRTLAPLLSMMLFLSTPASAQNFDALSTGQLREIVAVSHPSGYYVLASRLFNQGERDEAVFWFYAGEIRYRTHLACNPHLPPDGDAALFGALNDVIGREINAYAFGNLDHLVATFDQVIAWDAATPDGFLADKNCGAAHAQVLAGLKDLRAYVIEDAETIRAERLANGLPNR